MAWGNFLVSLNERKSGSKASDKKTSTNGSLMLHRADIMKWNSHANCIGLHWRMQGAQETYMCATV